MASTKLYTIPNNWFHQATLNVGVVTHPLDASTDAAEYMFQAEEAITIRRLGVSFGSRTGTPPTYKISLQGINTSGNPDGTIKGGGSPASKTFTPPADGTWDNTFQWFTLDNPYACSRGEFLSVVVAYDSGTINASNLSTLRLSNSNPALGWPQALANNAGSRSRAGQPIFGYGDTGTAYGFPNSIETTTPITNATTPDEIALRFAAFPGLTGTYTVTGALFVFSALAAGVTYKVVLYDGTTALQSVTVDSDLQNSTGYNQIVALFQETTLSELVMGNVYRLAIQPQAASGMSVTWHGLGTDSTNAQALPGGSGFYWSERTDAGAWTDSQLKRPLIEPIISSITVVGGSHFIG